MTIWKKCDQAIKPISLHSSCDKENHFLKYNNFQRQISPKIIEWSWYNFTHILLI